MRFVLGWNFCLITHHTLGLLWTLCPLLHVRLSHLLKGTFSYIAFSLWFYATAHHLAGQTIALWSHFRQQVIADSMLWLVLNTEGADTWWRSGLWGIFTSDIIWLKSKAQGSLWIAGIFEWGSKHNIVSNLLFKAASAFKNFQQLLYSNGNESVTRWCALNTALKSVTEVRWPVSDLVGTENVSSPCKSLEL